MPYRTIVGVTFIVIVSVVSKLAYKHNGRPYSKNRKRQRKDTSSFRGFEPFLRISTVLAGIASYFSDSSLLLKLDLLFPLFYFGLFLGMLGFTIFLLAKQELS